jgi:hypothetical protein
MNRRPRRPALVLAAGLTGLVVVLAGCSGSSGKGTAQKESAVKATPTSSAAPGTFSGVLPITFKGSTVSPEGEQVQAKVGKPFKMYITADKAGEMHVHSSPEQHIDYPAGTSVATITFDQPGVVEIESHTLNKQIVQVQVR